MVDDITFHSKRAMAELDLAVRADSTPAARAHFGLSALHLERMKQLAGHFEPVHPVELPTS